MSIINYIPNFIIVKNACTVVDLCRWIKCNYIIGAACAHEGRRWGSMNRNCKHNTLSRTRVSIQYMNMYWIASPIIFVSISNIATAAVSEEEKPQQRSFSLQRSQWLVQWPIIYFTRSIIIFIVASVEWEKYRFKQFAIDVHLYRYVIQYKLDKLICIAVGHERAKTIWSQWTMI